MTLNILAADSVARALRRDHDDVYILRRDDLLVMNVEAVCKCQNIAGLQIRLDHILINVSLLLIRAQHHDDVAGLCSLCRSHDLQAIALRLCGVTGTRTQTYNDVNAGILQVHCMCMTLGAKTDDCNGLAVQQGQVAVSIIKHLNSCHFAFLLIRGAKVR